MLPASVKILVCTERKDMRRSFDTLAADARYSHGLTPGDSRPNQRH